MKYEDIVLGVSKMDADSRWNPVYQALHHQVKIFVVETNLSALVLT